MEDVVEKFCFKPHRWRLGQFCPQGEECQYWSQQSPLPSLREELMMMASILIAPLY